MAKHFIMSRGLSNSNNTLFFNSQFISHLFQKNQLSNTILFLFKLSIISSLPFAIAQPNMSDTANKTITQENNHGGNSDVLGLTMLISLLMLMILLRLLFTSKIFNTHCSSDNDYREIIDNQVKQNYGTINQTHIELPNMISTPLHQCPSNNIEWSEQNKLTL